MAFQSFFLLLSFSSLLLLQAKHALSECVDNFPHSLDTGIYWASQTEEGLITWHKSCPGALSSVFDPQKESIVYFHGLQPGSVIQRHRFFIDDTQLDDYVKSELALGRNIGVYQWVQLADEQLPFFIRAEVKIVSPYYVGSSSYLYIDASDNKLKSADAPRLSVRELALADFRAHWPADVESKRVHIVGHSLGSQLVVHLAKLVIDDGNGRGSLARVTLLDPVFSDTAKPYYHDEDCGKTDATVLGCYMRELLDAGIAVELYRASFINRCIFSSENNSQMVNNSAAVALKFTKWGSIQDGYCYNQELLSHVTPKSVRNLELQLYNQHRAAVEWYVRSRVSGVAPRVCVREPGGGCRVTAAASVNGMMSDEDVLAWARGKLCLSQVVNEGSRDSDPSNDLFFTSPCETFNT